MSRLFKRLRQGVDGLLAPAPAPVSPTATPLAGHHAHLARIGLARQRLEQTDRVLTERLHAIQQHATMLQSEATQHVAHGRHDLAWHCLARRQTALGTVEGLAAQRGELGTHIARVVQIEQQLLAKIDAITQRREVITAQQQAALVQIELGETLTGLNDAALLSLDTSGIDETSVEMLQDQAMAIRRLIDHGLIEMPLIDEVSVDPNLKASIDAELAAIQQRVSSRTQGQRSES